MPHSLHRLSGHTIAGNTPDNQAPYEKFNLLVRVLAEVDIKISSNAALNEVPTCNANDVKKQLDSGSSFFLSRESMNSAGDSWDMSTEKAKLLLRSRSESPSESRERSRHTDKSSHVKKLKMQRSNSMPDMQSSREQYNRAVGHVLEKSRKNERGMEEMVKQIAKQSFDILDKLLEEL
jgi:hypothetical protein